MDETISFGEWVRQRRKALDLTRAILAERVGCAVITIRKIEQEERRPSREIAELLVEHLAIPLVERTRFLNMARGLFEPFVPAAETLRLPPFLQTPDSKLPPRFVARQPELTQLQAHLDQALGGHSRVVFITGEAGRGKTSLLAEFARQAQLRRPDLIVAAGVCSTHGDIGDPYLPFRDVFALLSGDLETRLAAGALWLEQGRRLWAFLPQTLQAILEHGSSLLNVLIPSSALLKRIVPYVVGQPAWLEQLQRVIEQQQAGLGQLEQGQLFEQVRQVLQTLAGQQPLLLLLDDLHWLDTASLNLLFHLGRRLDGSRILLLGAYRASEVNETHPLTPVVTELKRRFGDIQLDLEQFDPLTGRSFVDALLDSEANHLGKPFRERLFWHTKGHPLFTVELLRHLQERGQLIKDEQGRWIENDVFEAGNLPVRIEAVINQRLGRLDPALQDLVKVAAVEGEIFTAQVMAHVRQINGRLSLQQLSQLERGHWLIREHSEVWVGEQYLNRYQFSHVLFQHYLYRQLSQGERRWLHTAVAGALAELYQQNTAEIAIQLAHHYTQAGALTQAAAYHLIAGNRAMNGAALAEAVHYYRAALAGWPAEDEAGRAEVLRKLGECLWVTGQLPAALEIFKACYDLFARLENRMGAGAVQRLIGRIYWEQGERAISLQHYHQALTILEGEPESIELAQALSAISQMHMLASEADLAIAWGERALALAKRLGAKEVIVHASNNIGSSLATSANPDRGLGLLRESLQQAMALNMPHEACRAHVNLGEGLTWHNHYAEAKDIFAQLLVYATTVGAPLFQGVALVRLTELDWVQGRWATALTHCQHLRLWSDGFRGATVPKVWASTMLGRIHNDLGQFQAAREELERNLNTARTLDELQSTVPHLGQLARSLAAQGQVAEPLAIIQELVALFERSSDIHVTNIPPLLFACRWLAPQGSNSAVLEAAGSCLRYLERIESQLHSRESAAALAEVRGLEAFHGNKTAVAIEQFRQAAGYWHSLNRPLDQARVLNDLGRALSQTEDNRQAQAVFKQARDLREMLVIQIGETGRLGD